MNDSDPGNEGYKEPAAIAVAGAAILLLQDAGPGPLADVARILALALAALVVLVWRPKRN